MSAAFWLCWTLVAGPGVTTDSWGYLALTDALGRFQLAHADRPDRTPGYPLFLLAIRLAANRLGIDALDATAVVQCALLAGATTYLLYRLGRTLTGHAVTGVIAALLLAADPELQFFGGAILTEALTCILSVVMIWLGVRDGNWRRARWPLAWLTLTRPNFLVTVGTVAIVEAFRHRRIRAVAEAIWPATVAVAVFVSLAAPSTDLLLAMRRIRALCDFGVVYENDLWRLLPDGNVKEQIANLRRAGASVYGAATALTGEPEPWQTGSGAALRAVVDPVVRAGPLAYARARARALPEAFRQHAVAPLGRNFQDASLAPRALAWIPALNLWNRGYHAVLYSSFPLFLALIAVGARTGFGYPRGREAFRHLIVPYVGSVFVGVAAVSLGTTAVARLALTFRPFYLLVLAVAVTRALETCGALRRHSTRVAGE